MKRIMDKVRSLLVLSLSAAMIMTSMPNVGMVAQATQAGQDVGLEETLESTEVVETEVVESTEATEAVETEVVESTEAVETVETEVVEEAEATEEIETVEGVEDEASILEYQTTKLKLSTKSITVYAGDSKHFELTYAGTTSSYAQDFGYTIDVGTSNGDIGIYKGSVYNGKQWASLQTSSTCKPGKYKINIFPIVPVHVHSEPVTLNVTVKASANILEMPESHVLYKPAGKAVTYQAEYVAKQEYHNSAFGSADTTSVTTLKNVPMEWQVSYDPYGWETLSLSGNGIKVSKTGKVTVNKNASVSGDKFYVVGRAVDYYSNPTMSHTLIQLKNEPIPMKRAVITRDNYEMDTSKPFISSRLNYSYLKAYDENDGEISSTCLKFSSSNEKAITVADNGLIIVKQATGKPVTLTATATDGSKGKVSVKVTVEKATIDVDQLELYGTARNGGKKSYFEISKLNQTNRLGYYSTVGNNALLELYVGNLHDFSDLSIVKVTGGKNVTAAMWKNIDPDRIVDSQSKFYVLATAEKTSITFKSGGKTQVYEYVCADYKPGKLPFDKSNKVKATTSVNLKCTDASQEIAIYMGTEYAGKDMKLVGDLSSAVSNTNAYYTTMYAPNCGLQDTVRIGSDGYARFDVYDADSALENVIFSSSYLAPGKKVTTAKSFKMQALVLDKDGLAAYAPRIITVNVAAPSGKNDYKMKTEYQIPAGGALIYTANSKLSDMHVPITYTGTKEPSSRIISIIAIGGAIADDKETASDFAKSIEYGYTQGQYCLAVTQEAIQKLQQNPDNIGKTFSGDIYIKYVIETSDGTQIRQTTKVKVSYVVPAK